MIRINEKFFIAETVTELKNYKDSSGLSDQEIIAIFEADSERYNFIFEKKGEVFLIEEH